MTDDDWKKAGVMVRLNANSKFVEVEPEGLNSLLRDQARLEWMASHAGMLLTDENGKYACYYDDDDLELGQMDTSFYDSWRDAIDEAMRGE